MSTVLVGVHTQVHARGLALANDGDVNVALQHAQLEEVVHVHHALANLHLYSIVRAGQVVDPRYSRVQYSTPGIGGRQTSTPVPDI